MLSSYFFLYQSENVWSFMLQIWFSWERCAAEVGKRQVAADTKSHLVP